MSLIAKPLKPSHGFISMFLRFTSYFNDSHVNNSSCHSDKIPMGNSQKSILAAVLCRNTQKARSYTGFITYTCSLLVENRYQRPLTAFLNPYILLYPVSLVAELDKTVCQMKVHMKQNIYSHHH